MDLYRFRKKNMINGLDLLRAVKDGKTKELAELIENGADVNTKYKPNDLTKSQEGGISILSFAAQCGHTEIVKILLRAKAEVKYADESGKTALHTAFLNENKSFLCDIELIQALVENGAEINAKCNAGFIPIHIAITIRHTSAVKYLLSKDAKINLATNNGLTTLHSAVIDGHIDTVKLLVEHGADIDAKHSDGSSPLLLAVQDNYIDCVKILLENGAKIDITGAQKATPLHWASAHGLFDIAKLLVEKGADINRKDELGWTPILLAANHRNIEVAKYLKDKGAYLKGVVNGKELFVDL